MKQAKWFLLALLFSISQLASAQVEDLTRDTEFFKKQAQLYQKWLDHTGLGQVLQVKDVSVKSDQLSLYLGFKTQDVDSMMVAWDALKTSFEAQNPIQLEQQLFYKMLNIMEVRQALANVQIYDTYDLRQEPLFTIFIYYEAGELKIEKTGHKSAIRKIELSLEAIAKAKNLSIQQVEKKYAKQYIFDTIYKYAEKRYGTTQCGDRKPKITLLESTELLRFEVTNLCREVLTDAANPMLCKILRQFGYDCNWVKREKLVFTISYEETLNGFRLGVMIDGAYGSGYYEQVPRGGYINMEIDFDIYLEDYADQFREKVIQLLR